MNTALLPKSMMVQFVGVVHARANEQRIDVKKGFLCDFEEDYEYCEDVESELGIGVAVMLIEISL
ncbi:hypothetical protein Tco_0049649, partial [Tanacetum coccineum]